MKFPTYKHEQQKFSEGYTIVAGCDEVGMAPLAGPVLAATVVLDQNSIGRQRSKHKWWYRVRDSKQTTEKERMNLYKFIQDHCLDFGIGTVSHETIDEINIHQGGLLAMKKSVEQLSSFPDYLFLDGRNKIPNLNVVQQPVVDGDMKILSVAAASILAKVTRDEMLIKLHEQFPVYGFVKHKGYPTKIHREALLKFGVSPVHRKSFTFVAQVIKYFCSVRNFRKNFLIGGVA